MVIKYVYGALFLLFVGGDGTVASEYERRRRRNVRRVRRRISVGELLKEINAPGYLQRIFLVCFAVSIVYLCQ